MTNTQIKKVVRSLLLLLAKDKAAFKAINDIANSAGTKAAKDAKFVKKVTELLSLKTPLTRADMPAFRAEMSAYHSGMTSANRTLIANMGYDSGGPGGGM